MNAIITTIQKPPDNVLAFGKTSAKALGLPFIERKSCSLLELEQSYAVNTIIVATKSGPVVHTPGGEYFFHLSMADLRIKNIINGKPDHMISAMSLRPGMSVLDCTLGLATDAVVSSFVCGPTGQVVGLEASPIIAYITQHGLETLKTETPFIDEALRRILVKNEDYNHALYQIPDNSFDIVFFDPMFRQPVQASSNLKPLRYLADHRPLNSSMVEQAYRIAQQRVVIKEANQSPEFTRLGIHTVVGGKYSRVSYGILEKKGDSL